MIDRRTIAQLDSQQMLSSIEVLHNQCTEAWDATRHITYPETYRTTDHVVLFGMGGSALGMHIVQTLFRAQLRVPITIVNDYELPGCIDTNTLVILSSYSGTTEETIAAAQRIRSKTPNIVVVTTGGTLQSFAEEHHIPAYIFTPQYNPSNQPRMAVGYSVFGILGICHQLDLLTISEKEVAEMITTIEQHHSAYGADAVSEHNLAKQLAQKCVGKLPIFVSSEFLEGVTHVFTNQINENSKQFAVRFPIPEMDHHLIEGLVFPRAVLDQLLFVFIESTLYHSRNIKRYIATRELIERNHIQSTTVALHSPTPATQAVELLLFGSYTSLYLAIENKIDPAPIPNVNFLKTALQKT